MAASGIGQGTSPRGGGRRALVVDDDASNRRVAGETLRLGGFEVVEASSPEEALSLLRSGESFDVLVTDYRLPGFDGRSVIETARAISGELPCVLVSGTAVAEAQLRGTHLRDVAFVGKPFRVRDLLQAVQSVLDTSG